MDRIDQLVDQERVDGGGVRDDRREGDLTAVLDTDGVAVFVTAIDGRTSTISTLAVASSLAV